jgi:ApbE superfamily uncharacterized protein (UPF0280 family)
VRRAPQIGRLSDGRLHLQDGPIDLIVEAFGAAGEIERAYRAAAARFGSLLDELCTELERLRAPELPDSPRPDGPVARRMAAAVAPYCRRIFITPMAAVAGSVAEEILGAMTHAAQLSKAYVNNGGDIALHLSGEQSFSIGMVDDPGRPALFGRLRITAADRVRGIATSGRHGRSFSLGIADAVTVLAGTAAEADAAATAIANAVDLKNHAGIRRAPAMSFDPQSDLGTKLVTVSVAQLSAQEIELALDAGLAEAGYLLQSGLIIAAALHLLGETRTISAHSFAPPDDIMPFRQGRQQEGSTHHAIR